MTQRRSAAEPAQFTIVCIAALPDAVVETLAGAALGPFDVRRCANLFEAEALLAQQRCDLLLLTRDGSADPDKLEAVAAGIATVIVATGAARPSPASVLRWLQHGAQDVLLADDLHAASLALRLRAAIERQRLAHDARTAYATDLHTGLPHEQQLIEHMSQLIALREREPAPMALLALRIEGLAATEARLGASAAATLRRKLGVRLRAGVRASDVVAALGGDNYAVLLGSLLAPADAAQVGAKLAKALLEPFKVSGSDVAVATAIGIAQYPDDGAQPEPLLRRALGLAASAQAQGRAGYANFGESAARGGAANDE